MIIISIKFRSYASKTYDYLMRNPNNLKLDPNQDLSFISGVSKNKIKTTQATIVGFRRVGEVPQHVTSYLVIKENNIVESLKISGTLKTSPRHLHESTNTAPMQERMEPYEPFRYPKNRPDMAYLDDAIAFVQLSPIEKLEQIYLKGGH